MFGLFTSTGPSEIKKEMRRLNLPTSRGWTKPGELPNLPMPANVVCLGNWIDLE
jgi:hypothetical protein